jgi:hypothetical protein
MQLEIIKKLRLDINSKILLLNLPDTLKTCFEGINYDVVCNKSQNEPYDYVQIFATNQAELESLILSVKNCGKHDCMFWASYPKGTGQIKSNIKRETVWKAFELVGLDAVTQVAIDETWTALRARPIESVGTKKN